jgi:hypothetical protein
VVDGITGQPLAWVHRGQDLRRLVIAGQAFTPAEQGDVIEMRSSERGGSGGAIRYASRAAPITRGALRHLCRGLGFQDDSLLVRDGLFFHFGGALFARLLQLAGLRADALACGEDPRRLSAGVIERASKVGVGTA